MNEIQCPVCGQPETKETPEADAARFDCPRCGVFTLTGSMLSTLDVKLERTPKLSPVLSHHIRKSQRDAQHPVISTSIVERLLDDPQLPGPAEQAENLLLWLGEKVGAPGKKIELDAIRAPAEIGAEDEDGVDFILESLGRKGLIDGTLFHGGGLVRPSFDGWERIDELNRSTVKGTRAFMAMAFGNETLSHIVEEYFRPATRQAGFELTRLDDEPRAGSIDERLRVEIRRSAVLIADLSDANPGAYWEAGFAEGVGKPVVYTCDARVFKEHGTHFDTNHHHTVIWTENDPRSAAQELTATIRATLPHLAKLNDG